MNCQCPKESDINALATYCLVWFFCYLQTMNIYIMQSIWWRRDKNGRTQERLVRSFTSSIRDPRSLAIMVVDSHRYNLRRCLIEWRYNMAATLVTFQHVMGNLRIYVYGWLVSTFSWFEFVALIASSGSAHLLVLGLTVDIGDVTLQESVWNLLTLPEFNKNWSQRPLIGFRWTCQKTTDFSLGLQESFKILGFSKFASDVQIVAKIAQCEPGLNLC